MQAVDTSFSKILQIEGTLEHYHVPKYQREYTWGKWQWEKLIQDIDENDAGHYMGSIICVNDDRELRPGEERIYEVVDGQQRLTTLSILLLAIYTKYKMLEEQIDMGDFEESENFRKHLASLRDKLIKKKKEIYSNEIGSFKEDGKFCFLRVQPSSQNSNLNDYLYIISEVGIIKKTVKPKYCGVRLIYKTYKFFCSQIPDDQLGLENLIDKINRLIFIHISVSSQANAFILFETLNNRGVPLSAIDIIKNKMLSELEKQNNMNIDDSYEKWQELLLYLPDYQIQERFLRHFYNAFKIDKNIKIDKYPKATASSLIGIYESLIKKDANTVFNELIKKAQNYHYIIEPEEYEEDSLTNYLIDLKHIGTATAYQFLLYLFCLEEKISFAENNLIEKTISLLANYYVRRNITDFPATRDLDSINIELIEKCDKRLKSGNKLSYQFIEDSLLKSKGKPSSKETFREYLEDNLFWSNSAMARYVLIKLDSIGQSREYNTDLWQRNEKGLFVWTIEHVLPQGENIPQEWIDMIANGDKKEAEKIHEDWVHCIGNLTLSGYNSKLSNSSFPKKQSLHENKKFLGQIINIGYKNGLALNNLEFQVKGKKMSLANAPEWKKEMIAARNTRMVNILLDVFKFNGE